MLCSLVGNNTGLTRRFPTLSFPIFFKAYSICLPGEMLSQQAFLPYLAGDTGAKYLPSKNKYYNYI